MKQIEGAEGGVRFQGSGVRFQGAARVIERLGQGIGWR